MLFLVKNVIRRTLAHHQAFISGSSLLQSGTRAPSFLSFCSGTALYQTDCYQTVDIVNEICRVLSDFRRPHDDIETALNPFSGRITGDIVEQVLKRCKNLGTSAHRFFLWSKKIQGFVPSRESHHIMVDILGASKQFPLVWDFLLEMREEEYEISREIFWLVFRAYSKAKLPSDAVRAFKKMSDFGRKPDIEDLDQLLYVLCVSKLVNYAQIFFDKVKLEFPDLTPKSYSILINGWGKVGGSEEALKLFDEMRKRGFIIDLVAYNSIIGSLCRAVRVDKAYEIFQELKSDGLVPNAATYASFVRVYCEMDDIYSAFRVLDRMKRYGLVPNTYTYNCIIRSLCKNGKIDDAYKLLDEMAERGVLPDIWSYNAVQAEHCKHCEVNKALRLLHRMLKDGCSPDHHTYNMVLKMLLGIGRFDRAMEIWDSMGEKGFYPSVSTYSVMIHGLCKKKGKMEDACRYFEMMIDDGIPPYSSTCDVLRTNLLRMNLKERIEILAAKMKQSTSCMIRAMSDEMECKRKVPSYQEVLRETKRLSILEGEDWRQSYLFAK